MSSLCFLVYSHPVSIHFHLVLDCNKGLKYHELSYSSCSSASYRLFIHPDLSLQSWVCLCSTAKSHSSHQYGLHAVPSFQFPVIASFLYAYRYRNVTISPSILSLGLYTIPSSFLHDIFIDNPSIKLLCIILILLYCLCPDWKLSLNPGLATYY